MAPLSRPIVLALAGFSALSALAGGAELVWMRRGNEVLPPLDILRHTPFPDFLVPGLLLGVVVGGTSLAAMVAAWRRSPYTLDLTVAAGGALSVWILDELALLRDTHWLHALYGGLGLALLTLGLFGMARSAEPRHTWTLRVTLAEAAGFAVPATVGILTATSGPFVQAVAVVLAGAVEGLLLGAGQASAWPLPLNRARYALATSVAAAATWAGAMALRAWGDAGGPPLLLGLLGVSVGLGGLLGMGLAQWWELRRHGVRARWVGWTALAWALALPWSFAPGPLVDESTPGLVQAALWSSGGLAMAWVFALVSWQGVRRELAWLG